MPEEVGYILEIYENETQSSGIVMVVTAVRESMRPAREGGPPKILKD